MIKILKSLKYDKHFGIFYHMALSKYDKKFKKKPMFECEQIADSLFEGWKVVMSGGAAGFLNDSFQKLTVLIP